MIIDIGMNSNKGSGKGSSVDTGIGSGMDMGMGSGVAGNRVMSLSLKPGEGGAM